MAAPVALGLEVAARVRGLSAEARRAALSADPGLLRLLAADLTAWRRPSQVWVPGPEYGTVYTAGRGWGKTLTGSAAVDYVAHTPELCGGRGYGSRPGRGGVILIGGRTWRDVMLTMLEGESGLLRVVPDERRPRLLKQDGVLEWRNGTIARLVSGDKPEGFRGPNIGFAWIDEPAHWIRGPASLSNLWMTLRLGRFPRWVATSTPAMNRAMLSLLYDVDPDTGEPFRDDAGRWLARRDVRVVRGSSRENFANLGETYRRHVATLDGTRLGRQEVEGELLVDNPGAKIKRAWIRRLAVEDLPERLEVVVACDPAVTSREGSAQSGVVVLGRSDSRRVYVLDDCSGTYSPAELDAAIFRSASRWRARRVVVEDNNGGDFLAAALLRTQGIARIDRVRATRAKGERWALAATYWERGDVWHVAPDDDPRRLAALEFQLCDTDPDEGGRSDRGDAAVWGVLALLGDATDRGLGILSRPGAAAAIFGR